MNIGQCNYCKQAIPATTVNGEPCRKGIEYKEVLGDPLTKWHYFHPLFPNCFKLESADPESIWYDDPTWLDFSDIDDEVSNFEPAYYESLLEYQHEREDKDVKN